MLEAMVPQFILQPLVENAIRHGIAPHRTAGTIGITAESAGSLLRLTVRDDGAGLPEERPSFGVGLSNTRARLAGLYGEGGGLELRNLGGAGLEAVVEFPLRLVVPETAGA
jgi:LytS/YehU family sensor histidine kinase